MPIPKPHITKDSFFHEVPSSTPSSSLPSYPTTIYFISGNPGLISYYHAFLSLLGEKLSSGLGSGGKGRGNGFHVVGHSLAGFELEPGNERADEGEHYFDVEEQIRFVLGQLHERMRGLREASGSLDGKPIEERPKPKVIIIGHSVGTYISMEIIRRHRERQAKAQTEGKHGDDDFDLKFDIIGGIMLFPTVMDIAASPSGQKLTFLFRIIPQLALVASLFVRLLTTLLPDSLIRSLIRLVMRNPPEEALGATASFIQSKRGVRQALHMATDEMRVISADKWDDDVWGLCTPEQGKPPNRMYFYFGRNDHWVAERTREDIIALRGKASGGPKMVVCEESVPHAFCLRHNETMAGKVAGMITEILE
ncbi:bifunctional triacylglycerol lipase/ester hydrolase [Aspergillus stella-maris]|uniref:bifunctional triacylglycerol lipase/ester hydrolase n=1 Tax=Aspergillus stella-maris TaxID=1810926 RepID=UPI003CCD8C7B